MLRPSARSTRLGSPSARRGAAAMEFAVVSLVFFTFIMALFELGRGLMSDYLLVNAARQGCRAGIVPSCSTDSIKQATNTALANSRVTGATVSVQVNGAETEASSAQTGDRISVVVTVSWTNLTWMPFTRYIPGNLTGKYTLRRE